MITTTSVSTIDGLRYLYDTFNMPLGFLVLGSIPVSVLLIMEKLRETFLLIEVLISLSVLLWSVALPAVTKCMELLIFAPCVITIMLDLLTLIIGYETVKRSSKRIAVLLSGMFLAFAVPIKCERMNSSQFNKPWN
uniref:Uncharacterized protein n=1 Tax=Trichobilharzia regenti TaxID=157069 RepID=A0AA85JP46_TRIRE|nr:unnamed protein product [Trichobilharzia regenti]